MRFYILGYPIDHQIISFFFAVFSYFSGATSASSVVHTSTTCKQETTLQLIHLGPLYYFYTITADV